MSFDTKPPRPPPLQLQNIYTNNQNNSGVIDGSNNIVTSTTINEIMDPEDELEKLLGHHASKYALPKSFYSLPECYPNTCTVIRAEIGEWLDESKSKKSALLWLNGPAAVGKSTIVKTISVSHPQLIAAAFFFSTSFDRTAATLVPTLAWQLARNVPETKDHIMAASKNDGSPQTTQIEEQLNSLIIQPLKIVPLSARPVMVIDGIDECTDEAMMIRFLRVLVQASNCGDVPVRFIISSRPEPRIQAILEEVQDINPTTITQESTSSSRTWSGIILTIALIFGIVVIVGIAIYAALRLALKSGKTIKKMLLMPLIPIVALLAIPLVVSFVASFLPSHLLPRPRRHTRSFLREVWELYKPIRRGVDNDSSFSGELADTLNRISPHPVISTVRIGISKASKEEIATFLTDRFSVTRSPREGESSWFTESDISHLVDASCGQFMYVSIIVKLLDDPLFDRKDIFNMARRGLLPTADMDKLYKAVIKRAQNEIQNDRHHDYLTELRFLMDTLTILVFFEANTHFFTIPKSFPVIETLLGLKRGKLDSKLSHIHSVLRIVPGESIQVYHKSFVEFLQDPDRSGEYYISHSQALRRIWTLMIQAGFRYRTILFASRRE